MSADARRRRTHARRVAAGRNVLFSLYVADSLSGLVLEEELRAIGLTPNELGLLSAVGLAGGAVTPTTLAELLGARPTTLTSRIARVVERGYVRRIRNPIDGRSYILQMTESGQVAWRSAYPALRASLARIEEELRIPIDDVEETLVELERALRAALERGPRTRR